LDAKVDDEVDSVHVKRIGMEDLVGYVYIVRVDSYMLILLDNPAWWYGDFKITYIYMNWHVDSN
jgi:hypothetical protein